MPIPSSCHALLVLLSLYLPTFHLASFYSSKSSSLSVGCECTGKASPPGLGLPSASSLARTRTLSLMLSKNTRPVSPPTSIRTKSIPFRSVPFLALIYFHTSPSHPTKSPPRRGFLLPPHLPGPGLRPVQVGGARVDGVVAPALAARPKRVVGLGEPALALVGDVEPQGLGEQREGLRGERLSCWSCRRWWRGVLIRCMYVRWIDEGAVVMVVRHLYARTLKGAAFWYCFIFSRLGNRCCGRRRGGGIRGV